MSNTNNNYLKYLGEYKSDTYFSKYGMDIISTLLILFIICLLFLYFKVQSNKNYYIHGKFTDEKGNQQSIWNREKCKPHILPFSGYLYRPDPQESAFQTTMNNFKECIKNPFVAGNLELLNPFKLMANTLSVLLATFAAIISGIRSYIQSILDIIFVRFKENKADLTNIQIDIVKRFTAGIYNRLNESFRNLHSEIELFTTDTYNLMITTTNENIFATIKDYYERWIYGAILKNIGASLVAVGDDLDSTVIGALFSWIFFVPGKAILKKSIETNAELIGHSQILIGSNQPVPHPLGGAVDYDTDKIFSIFYGNKYDIGQDVGANKGGNIGQITDVTNASVRDLLAIWEQEHSNFSAQVDKLNNIINEYDEGGTLKKKLQPRIDKLNRWRGEAGNNSVEWAKINFIKDNNPTTIRLEINPGEMANIRSKRSQAAPHAVNYNIVILDPGIYDNQNAVFLLDQDWKEGLFGKTPYIGDYSPFDSGMTNKDKIKYIKTKSGQIYEDIVTLEHPKPDQRDGTKKEGGKTVPKWKKWERADGDGPQLTIAQRLYCSRMWYYGEELHSYVPKSIKIQQGNKTSNYSDGNLVFTLRAYTVAGKKKNFIWGHNRTRVGNLFERDYSFKNVSAMWSSACFGKNTMIKLSNNKEKYIWKIKPGDILENDNKVTGIMKCKVGSNEIFNLNNILVTGTHRVLYNGEFISTCEHPDAVKDGNYTEDYVYCLNTESKTIKINNHVFNDWDELNEKDITNLKVNLTNEFERELRTQHNNLIGKTIHKYIDSGFHPYTSINVEKGKSKYIKYVKCGDILDNGGKVTAVIKIDASDIPIYKHSINDTFIFGTQNLVYNNDNTIKTTYYNEKERELYQPEKQDSIKYLYHLLTDKDEFNINKTTFACYNQNLQIFL